MLKKRLITAAILIPLFILFVLRAPIPLFAILTALFVLLGAWEWSSFMGLQKKAHRIIYLALNLFLLKLALYVYIPTLLAVACAGWLIALGLVLTYPNSDKRWRNSLFWQGLMGCFVLIPTWIALNFIRAADSGPYIILFLFVLIWGADSGAYFAGKKWGKDKLLPNVSPGKTRQGMYGALFVTLFITLATLFCLKLPLPAWPEAIVLSLLTVLFSVLGDLFESMLKRNAGLKDSGTFFPGHGGVLDRIDSLTAAAPAFALGAWFLPKLMM